MTSCLCIHHKYKTCGFKQRWTGRLQSAGLALGWWEPDECHTRGGIIEWIITGSITSTSLLHCNSLPFFVCDDLGDDHWFPPIWRSYHPPACSIITLLQWSKLIGVILPVISHSTTGHHVRQRQISSCLACLLLPLIHSGAELQCMQHYAISTVSVHHLPSDPN